MEAPERQASSVLSSDTGTFGYSLHFFVRGNALYCRGIARDNNLSLLTHITGELYQLNENLQVQFIKNGSAQVTGVKMLNDMGYEFYWLTQAEKKNKVAWEENRTKAGRLSMPDTAVLSTYIGTYDGGLVFFRQGSELICRNAERGNEVFTLRYISGSLFQLDENAQVEFAKGPDGAITAIKTYWINGTESVKEKIR